MSLRTRHGHQRATCVFIALALAAAGTAIGVSGVLGAGAASTNRFLGSLSNVELNRPIVGIAPTRSGKGYWLVGSDGGVFTFGDAHFYGSTGQRALTAPIVGITATKSGRGYWLVGSDGGIFSFGDARYYGSTGQRTLAAPIVGMAATKSGRGYWLVGSDGGIFSFGDARYYGSAGQRMLTAPVIGMAATRSGHGYWLAGADGSIYPFGDARYYGSARGEVHGSPVVSFSAAATGIGYWLESADGHTFTFGHAHAFSTRFQSTAATSAPGAIVTIAASPRGGFWVASRSGNVGVSTLDTPSAAPARPVPTRTLTKAAARNALIAFQLVIRMNAERVARHLQPLAWDNLLAARANSWARTLLATDTFHHQNLGSIAAASGGRFEEVGENIYSGTGAADDAGTAHVSLMHSAEHRVNMLLPQGQLVGIGTACQGDKLMVVEDFAIRMGAPLPPSNQPMPPVYPIVSTNPDGAHC